MSLRSSFDSAEDLRRASVVLPLLAGRATELLVGGEQSCGLVPSRDRQHRIAAPSFVDVPLHNHHFTKLTFAISLGATNDQGLTEHDAPRKKCLTRVCGFAE